MNVPPPAPMAPMHDFPPDFPPPPPGAIHVDDWAAAQVVPQGPFRSQTPMVEYFDEAQEAKTKKKDKKNTPVEITYEGYILEKAEPLIGERPSWQRVGKRAIPVDDAKLVSMVKAHRKRTRTGPTTDFGLLSANQQGIVNRLIAERNREEKNTNADWILVDVQRFGTWHWSSLEVKKIQIVLKRQDKNQTKGRDKSTPSATSGYQYGEIIDLSDPLPGKKDKKGGKGEKKDPYENMEYIDDPVGLGLPPIDVGAGPGNHFDHGGHMQHHPMPMQQLPMQPPQHQLPAPMPHPVDPQYPAARPPFQEHPFQPYPELMTPGLMGPPPQQPNWGGQPHYPPQDEQYLQRRPSARRSSSARRLKRVEGKIDDLKYLNERIIDWHISSDSSEGHYDEESIFTPPLSGGSFTPPSTPPMSPKGSLHHRKSFGRVPDEGQYYPRSRPRYYDDERAEIQPGYTYRSNRGRRYSTDEPRIPLRAIEAPRYRDSGRRPSLHHANTYDDYPRAPEQRQVRAPTPPRRVQRRLTDIGQRYDDYANADFDEQNRRQREERRRNSAYDDVYVGGRRAARRVSGYHR